MKKLILIGLLFVLKAQATISELASYNDLDLSQIDQNTLVIFDIDNTLLRQDSMIGTHQWGDYMRERAIRHGLDAKAATELQHKLFGQLQAHLKTVPVETKIYDILQTLTAKGIPHFALTARGPAIQDVTIQQVRTLNHNFAQSFPEQKDLTVLNGYLREGIIFSGSTPKGELLKTILENSVHKPTKVIFVDDRGYNLDSVEASLKDYPVELISYRYGGADSFVKSFDPIVADLVYSFFIESQQIISDQEARMLTGNLVDITQYRYELYLQEQGPLAQDLPAACELNEVQLQSSCDYLFDGLETNVTFEYVIDDFTHSIYFGNW